MPSTYAHYRFGNEVFNKLPNEFQSLIDKRRNLYNIGLHGPDILFYYKPLFPNEINKIGYDTHKEKGSDFFSRCKKVERENSKEYLIYLYGLICHYVLDSNCHGYIAEKIVKSGISHTEIEVEFDRSLMIEDGFNPITKKLTDHIEVKTDDSIVIANYFQGVKATEINKALNSMKWYNNLLVAPGKVKRQFIYGLLKITNNFDEMHGLIVNYKENIHCKDSTEKLKSLYNNAIDKAVELIITYENLTEKQLFLEPKYIKTFGGN